MPKEDERPALPPQHHLSVSVSMRDKLVEVSATGAGLVVLMVLVLAGAALTFLPTLSLP